MAESVLKTLTELAPKVKANPEDYQVRAELMWCATVGLNGWLGLGAAAQDWATHMIGHELTALYGLDHARTLAVIMPAVHRFQLKRKQARLAQFGKRVFHVVEGDEATRATQAIERMEKFFQSIDVPTRLSAYNIDAAVAGKQVSERLAKRGAKLGEYGDIGPAEVEKIIALAK
jgi:NADP-dependent alcohol dehydrogenase